MESRLSVMVDEAGNGRNVCLVWICTASDQAPLRYGRITDRVGDFGTVMRRLWYGFTPFFTKCHSGDGRDPEVTRNGHALELVQTRR